MTLRWLPAAAILGGLVTRIGAEATWLIAPGLMLIMLAAFVETRALEGWRPSRFLGRLLTFQLLAATGLFVLLHGWSRTAAIAALVLALTPTAVSAAAVASAARADVRLVTSTIAANNLIACATFPVAAWVVHEGPAAVASFVEPVRLVGMTVVLPFGVALVALRVHPAASSWAQGKLWRASLRALWAAILWVSAAKVGDWYSGVGTGSLIEYVWPLLLGVGAFGLFALLGRVVEREKRLEAVICYGHKNSGLALLLVLSSFPMAVAASVLCYSLAQNIFFSVLLARQPAR